MVGVGQRFRGKFFLEFSYPARNNHVKWITKWNKIVNQKNTNGYLPSVLPRSARRGTGLKTSGKSDLEIQTDTEAKAMELQERPFGQTQRGPAEEARRIPDYMVYAASELKIMLRNLTERLIDTPASG